ncbi:MAG: response regulator [Candidatus Zixiibacteriota bacterium]|nr:MAG: response regulator [candidate division Zixibacteria bacterium]
MKVLLVEDDPATLKVIKTTLTAAEYDVTIANSRRSAINELNSRSLFDLIICALYMSGMDGFQFLEYVQSNPRYNKIPIVIASSHHDRDSVVRSIELGARDFIVKPVDPKILLTKVQHVIEHGMKAILIVDDDPMIRKLLKKIVEREGYRSIEAESSEQALEVFDPDKIGLVISDIEMPGMNGLELLKAIKEKNPRIPVFIITGRSHKYDKHDVIESGADGYISKPFKNFEIARRVAAFIT